jgi:hypothetical protein
MAFLADHSRSPEMGESPEPGKACKAPWLNNVKLGIMKHCGCTREEAWSYPVGEALWDLVTAAEIEGAESTLITAQDKADIAELMAWKQTPEGIAAMAAMAERQPVVD